MSDDEQRRAYLLGHTALTQFEPMLDMLDGFVAATVRRGFTQEQARAIVASSLGWRPPAVDTSDGVGE